MFGTFVQSIIIVTDGAFVSELGSTAYNAVGNGGLMYAAMFMLCRGISDGTQITVAKKLGEQKNEEIGKVLFNAQFLQLLLTSLIFISFFVFGEIIIRSIAKSEDIGTAMVEFIKYRSWGIFFAGLLATMVAYFIGIGKTKIIILSTLLLALTNVFLDYSLIFGHFGFPELGMKGAPIASSFSEAVAFFFLLAFALKAKSLKQFAYTIKQKVNKVLAIPLFKLSLPLMFQGLLSLSSWLIFFSLIEHMGPENLEVAHNIRYMYFIAFIPIFGFAATTKTFVSNLVGRDEQHLIPKIQLKILLLSVISILVLFHGSFLYPEQLISIVEHNPNVSKEMLGQSADALRFISGSIIIFAMAIVPFHSVSALGKTTHSFAIESIALVLYIIACYFVIYKWNWDIVQIWWVEYIYFGSLGIFSLLYLLYYRRKFLIRKGENSNN